MIPQIKRNTCTSEHLSKVKEKNNSSIIVPSPYVNRQMPCTTVQRMPYLTQLSYTNLQERSCTHRSDILLKAPNIQPDAFNFFKGGHFLCEFR